jgi:hypothetical protein
MHIVAESRADDSDERGQRGLGDERSGPQHVADLGLREGLGAARHEQGEEVIGLRLEGKRHDPLLLHAYRVACSRRDVMVGGISLEDNGSAGLQCSLRTRESSFMARQTP